MFHQLIEAFNTCVIATSMYNRIVYMHAYSYIGFHESYMHLHNVSFIIV